MDFGNVQNRLLTSYTRKLGTQDAVTKKIIDFMFVLHIFQMGLELSTRATGYLMLIQ